MAKTLRAEGRELAVQLLRQIEEFDGDACCIDAGIRAQMGFGAQLNPVAAFLEIIRERASAELEAGVGEVLTDFISSSLTGGAPDPEFYADRIDPKVAMLARAYRRVYEGAAR